MKIRKNTYPIVVVIVLVIIVVFILRGVWGVYQKKVRSSENLAKAEMELVELRKREAELATDIERINTTHGIEAEIVTKYNVAKEGERVIHILENEEVAEEVTVEEKGFWERFWERIF